MAHVIAALLALSAVGTPIKPERLTTEAALRGLLGEPCATSQEQRTGHRIFWYMAERCSVNSHCAWRVAACPAERGPAFPFHLAYAFEVSTAGLVVDSSPPPQ